MSTRLASRFLLLSLLAYVLAFAAQPAPPPGEVIAWGQAAQRAVMVFLPAMFVLALLAELERRRPLLERLGMSIRIHRSQRPAHNCKI